MAVSVIFAAWSHYLFGFVMTLTAIFLILLVLVQRGRGGGLAGALGGMGGQSAFGTKAGDTFTFVTYGAASFWILLCAAAVWFFSVDKGQFGRGSSGVPPGTGVQAPPRTGEGQAPDGASGEPVAPKANAPGANLPGASGPASSTPSDTSGNGAPRPRTPSPSPGTPR